MAPLTAFLFETGAKVALLLAAFLIASLCHRGAAKSRHALQFGSLTASLLLPLCVLLLPRWQILDLAWLAPRPAPAPVATFASGVRAPDEEMLVWIWVAGVAALLLREVFVQVTLVRWARRATTRLSPAWRAAIDAASHEFPKLRAVTVLECADGFGPCTWGVVRPILMLPTGGQLWSDAERRLALVHELAHVRRFDCLTDLIGRLACALHWYNPLVWWAAAKARRLQEQSCDDQVLLSGARASDYARFLVNVGAEPMMVRGAAAMAGASPLAGRVRAVLQARAQRVDANPWRHLLLLGILTIAGFVLASVSPLARAQSVAQLSGASGGGLKQEAGPALERAAPLQRRAPGARRNGQQSQPLELVSAEHATLPGEPLLAVPATPPTPVIPAMVATPPTPPTPVSERRRQRTPGADPP